MTEKPVYVGIDLGTSNSAVSVFDGTMLTTVRTASGSDLTPSVVRIDGRGNIVVGTRARRSLDTDPANTCTEFKRLMGVEHAITFPASGRAMHPPELAAEVLKSLRQDIADQFGKAPASAVIAVPALFELHQTAATAEAARLAGFETVEMLQEPVASALAAGWTRSDDDGPWLVYDLGGGTFDVSLLDTQDGLLRVAGHDGDNFLGGRDFDRALSELILSEAGIGGTDGSAARKLSTPALARVRAAAEEAKIELTRRPQASVYVTGLDLGGEAVDIDCVIERTAFEARIMPLVQRSIDICLRLLKTHGLGPDDLRRLVLVGGPTVMPILRQMLGSALVAPFTDGLDPMLLVSQGAALHAAALGLDARKSAASRDDAPSDRPKTWLQYPAMTSDLTPFVVGKLIDPRQAIKNIRVEAVDGGWVSDSVEVEADGTFLVMVRLVPRQATKFRLIGLTPAGDIGLDEFTIIQGLAIGEPPLSRSVGVALANDRVLVFFERGSPLPIRRSFTMLTAQTVAAGASEDALHIPIVQGEFALARHCRLVGMLKVPATLFPDVLPTGSEVELVLELGRGGELAARARIVRFDIVVDQVARLVTQRLSLESIDETLNALRLRLPEVSRLAFQAREGRLAERLAELTAMLSGIESNVAAFRVGDVDAGEQARRSTCDLDAALAEVEAELALPALGQRVESAYVWALGWVAHYGDEAERTALANANRVCRQALQARDPGETERQLAIMNRLGSAAYFREPSAWDHALDTVSARVGESTDLRRATDLVASGRAAQQGGDRRKLEEAVRALWNLMPSDAERRVTGHGSGLRAP